MMRILRVASSLLAGLSGPLHAADRANDACDALFVIPAQAATFDGKRTVLRDTDGQDAITDVVAALPSTPKINGNSLAFEVQVIAGEVPTAGGAVAVIRH